MDHFEDVIAEAAQIALKYGLTTVFDTWGPRRPLMNVRDQINAGKIPGSRMFVAGNIVGFDGPFSPDFDAKAAELASADFVKRVNSIWVENVGRHLMWLPPEQVGQEVAKYVAKGVDFIKYGANEHYGTEYGAFLAFSPEQQVAIVKAAHQAGITAQAHIMSIEGLRLAVEAGCDLITHANITGPVLIPESTLQLMARRRTGTVVFAWPQRATDWYIEKKVGYPADAWRAYDTNARNYIHSDALIMMAHDNSVHSEEQKNDPESRNKDVPEEDNPGSLDNGNFVWLRAMEEKGLPPMKLLQAATRNVAIGYHKEKDLGTLEKGKFADLLILDKDPLQAAANYRSIHMIIKEGAVVDRDSLPLHPILTKPLPPPVPEEASYVPFVKKD
jgi:imidazolonepropionase-like amidohydrolase